MIDDSAWHDDSSGSGHYEDLLASPQNGRGEPERWFDTSANGPSEALRGAGSATWDDPYTLESAFEERPPLDFAIEGIFPIPSLSILYSPPGEGKSMLLMDAAICVAAGKRWLTHETDPQGSGWATRKLPTFWYDYDNGSRRCHERFQALAKGHGLSPSDGLPFYYLSVPSERLDASSVGILEGCFRPLIDDYGVQFVCIDNLSTISGDMDENSVEMVRVMSNLRAFAEVYKIACVVIHHQRKGNGNGKERAGESLRGHSSINAAVDLALQLKGSDGLGEVTLTSTKSRGKELAAINARFTFTPRPDQELDTARFYGTAPSKEVAEQRAISLAVQVIAEHGPMNKSSLTQHLETYNISKGKARKAIKDCVQANKLSEAKGSVCNELIYSLPT